MDKKKIYATLGKPSEARELYAAFVNFKVEVAYITITNKKRINKNYIKTFFKELKSKVKIVFVDFDFHNSPSQYYNFLEQFVSEVDYFALSLYYNRHIYKASPLLKKKDKTIIHLSDGVTNAFTLFGYILGFRSKGIFSFFKSLYIYFEYKKSIADVSFFSLYPLKNCFAKETYPLIQLDLTKPKEIDLLDGIHTQIVPGWGMESKDILEFMRISESYCASSKGLEIDINGQKKKIENYITAEDIIDHVKIKRIIGTPSTALLYAKVKHPEIQVDCILTGVLNKTFGIFYEQQYKKLGKKIGINFYKL